MCWSRVTEFSKDTALVDGASGSKLTFTEARSLARAFANGLFGLGASKGDVLAIVMPNCPDYIVTFLGASEAGLVVTTLNPVYTAHEIRGQLNNSEAKYVVTTPLLLPKVHNQKPNILLSFSSSGQRSFRRISSSGDCIGRGNHHQPLSLLLAAGFWRSARLTRSSKRGRPLCSSLQLRHHRRAQGGDEE